LFRRRGNILDLESLFQLLDLDSQINNFLWCILGNPCGVLILFWKQCCFLWNYLETFTTIFNGAFRLWRLNFIRRTNVLSLASLCFVPSPLRSLKRGGVTGYYLCMS
jgi:hypothetical protein